MRIQSLSAALKSSWPWWMPAAGLAALLLHPERADGIALTITGATLVGCVLAAVHHSEVVAHRIGEPFGTLILAGAVTIIEASLILSMMLSGSANPALPRDTVFAAIMLILNGVVGACLLVGGIRHGEQRFVLEGVNAALCVLAAMATLVLVLPSVSSTPTAAPGYSEAQLLFTAVVSTILYATFVFVQTIRHRDYFLPAGEGALARDAHASPPSTRTAAGSLGLLLLASPNRSKRRSPPPRCRARLSASRLPRWCSRPRVSRPCARRGAIACRLALISHWGRRLPPSGSLSRRSRSRRF